MGWERDDKVTQDLLRLACDRLVMLSVIESWSDEQCKEADRWSVARHFHAGEDVQEVGAMPAHVAACPVRACGMDEGDLTHL